MALIERLLNFTFSLASGKGVFQETGTATLNITGLRASVRIDSAFGDMGSCSGQIWGMTLSQMNLLSTLGQSIQSVPRGRVTVFAGDAVSGMSKVFFGDIVWSYGDFNQQPSVPFVFQAFTLHDDALTTPAPQSFSGSQDVATLIKNNIAPNLSGGLPFFNNGVSQTLSNPYLWGPYYQQLLQILRAANIGWNGACDGTLQIWPLNGNSNQGVVLVSSETGMIGSPSYTKDGILVRTIFIPTIKQGTQLNIVSKVVPVASSAWKVYQVNYALDSLIPKGEWFLTALASNPSSGQTPVGGKTT